MWSIFVFESDMYIWFLWNISIDLYITIKRSLFFKRHDVLWNCVCMCGKQNCICNQKKNAPMFSFQVLKAFQKLKNKQETDKYLVQFIFIQNYFYWSFTARIHSTSFLSLFITYLLFVILCLQWWRKEKNKSKNRKNVCWWWNLCSID